MEVRSNLLQEQQMLDSILERPSLEGTSFAGTPRLSPFTCNGTTPELGAFSHSSVRQSVQSSVAVLSSSQSSAFPEVSAAKDADPGSRDKGCLDGPEYPRLHLQVIRIILPALL